jgi:Zn-dependent peptidase ImmA (M78 family)
MSQHDFAIRVPPRSTEKVREAALALRRNLEIDSAWFPLVEVIEHVLPRVFDDFTLDIRTEREMRDIYGAGTAAMTTPATKRIELREDVYDQLHLHEGRARFTVAHELGHLFLHQGGGLARTDRASPMKIYESAEWQADTFAAELLIPLQHAMQCMSVDQMMMVFGVSRQAAAIRWKSIAPIRAQRTDSPGCSPGVLG